MKIRRLLLFSITLLVLFMLAQFSYIYSQQVSTIVFNSMNSGNRLQQHSPSSCPPVRHIMFLKSHKCASSTIQTLFLKYGFQHNLTFALPASGNYLGNPAPFKADMIPPELMPSSGKVDIFCVHSRLNLLEHARVLQTDAVYITAVRDPADLFESVYTYFRMHSFTHMSLQEYISLPLEVQLAKKRKKHRYGNNMMLFNLGFTVLPSMSTYDIQQLVEATDTIFDLVMIVEKLDESLILMKEYLCWDLRDVVFLVKNARKDTSKKTMSSVMREKLLQLNSADVQLYNYFLAKHEKLVDQYGREKMAVEVKLLNIYKEELYNTCKINMTQSYQTISKNQYFNRVNAYTKIGKLVKDCKLLMAQELNLLKVIRRKYNKILVKDEIDESILDY